MHPGNEHPIRMEKLAVKSAKAMHDLLEDVIETVTTDRMIEYGRPAVNYRRIAGLWNSARPVRDYIDTEKDVVVAMILTKIARLMETPDHYDSWKDIAGYAAVGWAIVVERGEQK